MIGYVKGILEEIEEDCVIVDVNGLGIRILTGGALASQMLALGSEVKIYTYTYVKEDAFQLYGFISKDELSLFKKLITVSGIGPKGAASILSAFQRRICAMRSTRGISRQFPKHRVLAKRQQNALYWS